MQGDEPRWEARKAGNRQDGRGKSGCLRAAAQAAKPDASRTGLGSLCRCRITTYGMPSRDMATCGLTETGMTFVQVPALFCTLATKPKQVIERAIRSPCSFATLRSRTKKPSKEEACRNP